MRIYLLLLVACSFSLAATLDVPMPESLVGYWPLEEDLHDIANGNDLEPNMPVFTSGYKGNPVSLKGKFATVANEENALIGHKELLGLPSKFTLSFYFKTTFNKKNGGIVMFWPHILAEPRFSLSYHSVSREWSYLNVYGGPKNEDLIGQFAILPTNRWNFVAITYDKSNGTLSIFNEDGLLVGSANAEIPIDASATLDVGYSYYGADHLFMTPQDGLFCLAMYKAVLTPEQISQLADVCQTTPAVPTTAPAPETTKPFTQPPTTQKTEAPTTTVKPEELTTTLKPVEPTTTTTTKPTEQPTTPKPTTPEPPTSQPITTLKPVEPTTTPKPTTKPVEPTTTTPVEQPTTKPAVITTVAPKDKWPQPDKLIGFWPLSSNYKLQDIGPKSWSAVAQDSSYTTGPFGDEDTAAKPTADNEKLLAVRNTGVTIEGTSFTVSMYLKHDGTATSGGIFEFLDKASSTSIKAFQFRYENPTTIEISANGVSIGHITIVESAGEWTYIAMTFNYADATLTIYGKSGIVLEPIPKPQLKNSLAFSNAGLRVGYSARFKQGLSTGDAVACVMVYSTALTSEEVSAAQESCRVALGGAQPPTVQPPTTQKPAEPTTKPVEPVTTKPAEPTTKPVEPVTTKPVEPVTTLKPAETTTKPVGPTTTAPPKPQKGPWPQADKLIGFWPLSSTYKLQDIGPKKWASVTQNQIFTSGPFGDDDTAAKPTAENDKLLAVRNTAITVEGSSFSVSMFFKYGETAQTGALFEFLDKASTTSIKAFQFRYENPTTIEISANGVSIAHVQMIQPKGAWTYIAMVYNNADTTLTVYGKNGVVMPAFPKPQLKNSLAFSNGGLRVGYSARFKQGMAASDAAACVMLYSTALTSSEVYDVYDACRATLGAAPCGSPKLPLMAIPTDTAAKVPQKPGQFPYVATIRSDTNTLLCSATILDEFWLLTSATCITATPGMYKVTVGEYDLSKPETFAKEHAISKIIKSGAGKEGNLALIQVTEPIDFTNDYVNVACLADDPDDFDLNKPQFVYGWGENGRPELLSKTLPRHAGGIADGICSTDDAICFMGEKNSDVPCTGDEGSPLLVQVPADDSAKIGEHLMQVGVYYGGRDATCSSDKPGLFARIAEQSAWIAEKIACAVPGVVYPTDCPQK